MSFEYLVQRISPRLKRITRKLNGHHSFFDDDDLYQEALSHLWIKYTEGFLVDKTDSYVLKGCYFHLKNYLRKVHDHSIHISLNSPLGEDGMSLCDMLSSEENPFDYIESKLHIEAEGLLCLNKREKDVVSYFLEGMSMREIGHKLGISHVMVLKIRNKIKDKYTRLNEVTRGG
ncbi:MAG TPA: hypothetical protein DDW17_01610 [Deltaproteobacteria bacterium]|nr:hypothetical protein [Deltaproteobacteria bacterium]